MAVEARIILLKVLYAFHFEKTNITATFSFFYAGGEDWRVDFLDCRVILSLYLLLDTAVPAASSPH